MPEANQPEPQPVPAPSPAPATAVRSAAPAPEPVAPHRLWLPVGLRFHLAVILTLGTLVLMTYANSFNTGFALDNKFILQEDPRLREASGNNIRLIFQEDYWWPKAVSGLYRPLTTLTYWLNYTGFANKNQAAGYHWVNFLLHWINTCLVYFVVLALMGNIWPALFVAALWGVHPINTESVTNIIGRADLLAVAGVLGALLCYAKSQTRHRPGAAARPFVLTCGALFVLLGAGLVGRLLLPDSFGFLQGWMLTGALVAFVIAGLLLSSALAGAAAAPWLLGMAALSLFGLFAKESAVVILGVCFLYDFLYRWQPRRTGRVANFCANLAYFAGRGYLALVPVYFAWWFVRHQVFLRLRPPELPFVDNPLVGTDPYTAMLTAIKVLGKYIALLCWPQTLSCDYSYNQIPLVRWSFVSWEDWKALIALAVVVLAMLAAVRNYRRNRALSFFILFFLVTFAPTSNLVTLPEWLTGGLGRPGTIMAERLMYLPAVGFAGWLVMGVYALCRKIVLRIDVSDWALRIWLQLFARTILGLIIIALGARAFARNFDWQDDVTLWSQAVKAAPDSFKTHKSLAFALYEQDPEGKEIDRIIEEGEKALAITDKTQIVLLHLGAYYRIKGDSLAQKAPDGTIVPTPQSRVWYEKSASVLARAVPLDNDFNKNNREKELKRGRRPEEIVDVGNHEIYWNLGLSLLRLARYQEALKAYAYMRHLAPTNPDAYLSIASVHLSLGQLEPAAIALLQTLLLDNSRQETLRLLVDLYRQIDREGCAVVFAQGQPRLNVDCAIVRSQMCNAYLGLVEVFAQARQLELAQKTRDNALNTYKCAPEAFQRVLGGPAPTVLPATPPSTPVQTAPVILPPPESTPLLPLPAPPHEP